MATTSSRRFGAAWVPALGVGAAIAVAVWAAKPTAPVREYTGAEPIKPVTRPTTSQFYKADGAFDAAAAKEAYFAMMRAYGCPIPAFLKTKEFWVTDFLQRDFATLGMGGVFWLNTKGTYGTSGSKSYKGPFKDAAYGYLGHEIYLLPGQMLPEHRHMGGAEGYGPKMEGWHVRYGSIELFGEEQATGDETPISAMPAAARPFGYGEPWFKSKYVTKRSAGEFYRLATPETWHSMRAGPNGAIVSEYATYHNNVEFSKPGLEFASSGPRAK